MVAIARQTVEDAPANMKKKPTAMRPRWSDAARAKARLPLFPDGGRPAGLGRASVGGGRGDDCYGNIDHATCTMTTAIALETSKATCPWSGPGPGAPGRDPAAQPVGCVCGPCVAGCLSMAAPRRRTHALRIHMIWCWHAGGRAVLDGFSLELDGEGITILLGPGYAGKSVSCAARRHPAPARCEGAG